MFEKILKNVLELITEYENEYVFAEKGRIIVRYGYVFSFKLPP